MLIRPLFNPPVEIAFYLNRYYNDMWKALAVAAILATVYFSVRYENGKYFTLLMSALVIRFLAIPIFPEITTADISDYLPALIEFSRLVENKGLLTTILTYIGPHVRFYTILYPGFIYTIYGENGFSLVRIINACLSVSVLPILNEINKLVFNRQIKRWQAIIVLFWPSYVFFSVELGRTVPGVIFILLSVYYFLNITIQPKMKWFFLFILASAAVVMIRVYYAVYPLGLIVSIYGYKLYLNRQNYLQVGVSISMVGIITAIGIYLFPYEFSIESINSLAAGIADGGSAYLVTVYPTSFLDLAWYMPLQAVYFQFSPFIWDIFRIGGFLTVIALFQATLVLILLIATTKKVQSPLVNYKFGLIILTILGAALLLGIGVKNTGSAMRWRLPSELLIITISSTVVDYEYLAKNGKS